MIIVFFNFRIILLNIRTRTVRHVYDIIKEAERISNISLFEMTNNSKLFYCQLIRVMRPFQTIIQINIRWTNVNFCRIEGLEMNFELRFHVLKKICRIYHLWVIIIKRKKYKWEKNCIVQMLRNISDNLLKFV